MSKKSSKETIKVIPNSSFFVFFLDDIKRPDILLRIIKCDQFNFVLCKKVKEETRIETRLRQFSNNPSDYFEDLESSTFTNYAEILVPFISKEEITKGEHEVLIIAYLYHNVIKQNYLVVIDDKDMRKFIERNFPEISKNVLGTLGLIKYCYHRGILSRDDVIGILKLVESSKFRVDKETLERIKKQLV